MDALIKLGWTLVYLRQWYKVFRATFLICWGFLPMLFFFCEKTMKEKITQLEWVYNSPPSDWIVSIVWLLSRGGEYTWLKTTVQAQRRPHPPILCCLQAIYNKNFGWVRDGSGEVLGERGGTEGRTDRLSRYANKTKTTRNTRWEKKGEKWEEEWGTEEERGRHRWF